MKKTLVFIVLIMLTASEVWSQDDTKDKRPIVFPFWMVQEIELDLNELDYLRAESTVNTLKLKKHQELVESYETRIGKKDVQIELLERLANNYKVQYEAKKAQKNPRYSIEDLGLDMLKFGAGALAMLLFLVTR
ncbi:hypothetical protein [Salinimicrobium sp. WS361]|uniref:hypothetical protein n=1 Tax=Salinimicrobium sp. WS361 TaxID=3425123 RepID=UPI003D6EA854